MRRIFLLSFLFLFSCQVRGEFLESNPFPNRSHILYLMRAGYAEKSLEEYRLGCRQIQKHDLELLQDLALLLLNQGEQSTELSAQILSYYGAGIALNEKLFPILENGVKNAVPQIQSLCLQLLARLESDAADEAMNRAISSNSLLVRLQAIALLAEKRYPTALGQAEALMSKLPPELLAVFPPIYARIGDDTSIRLLRKLLAHPNRDVRISAVVHVAKEGRDDLLPQIRMSATHHDAAEQEACALALGMIGNDSVLPLLEKMATSSNGQVRLAAWISLHHLGQKQAKQEIIREAKRENLYAISELGKIEGTEEVLFSLLSSPHFSTRINASISLLQLRDPRCLPLLNEVFIKDTRDLVFYRKGSPGFALSFCEPVPCTHLQQIAEEEEIREVSLNFREQLLTKTLELPEEAFFHLATYLFEKEQNDLIPTLASLLENLRSKRALALLHKESQRPGAPLIRNYCNLTLYRLGERGPCETALKNWVSYAQKEALIKFRPLLLWGNPEDTREDLLTAEEGSRLLIETFESLAQGRDDRGIDLLLDAIQSGHPDNRYVLAGLLLRASL